METGTSRQPSKVPAQPTTAISYESWANSHGMIHEKLRGAEPYSAASKAICLRDCFSPLASTVTVRPILEQTTTRSSWDCRTMLSGDGAETVFFLSHPWKPALVFLIIYIYVYVHI